MKKILIADDIQGWRNYHSERMRELFNNDCEIKTACSAAEGYNLLLENNSEPFDIILTDLQMESDYEPKYAGEWFVEQIKALPNYGKTKVVMISATYSINIIAENLGVLYIRKSTAKTMPEVYKEVLL